MRWGLGSGLKRRDPTTASVPRVFVLVVTVVFTLACAAPYVLAGWRAPPGTRFTGVLYNHFDQGYYRAAQRSAAHALPNRNRFTAEPGAPGPVSPLYPLLGRIQRTTGLPAVVVYHLPRVLAAAVLPLLLLHLFQLCFPCRREPAAWAMLFALFAAGVLTFAPGLSFAIRSGERIPESNVLYSLTVFPHFAVSYVGIVLAFTALAMALRSVNLWKILVTATGAGILLALGHAFLLLPFVVVLLLSILMALVRGIMQGARSPSLPRLLTVGVIVVPAAPVVFLLRREQMRLEQLQGFNFPTSTADRWWTWVMGYGVVSLLAVVGVLYLLRRSRRDALAWLLLAWMVVQFAFVYLPYTVFQRRFSEGLIVPVAGLAGAGAAELFRRSAPANRALRDCVLGLLVVGAVLIVNLLGFSGEYVSDAVDDLAATVDANDLVLAGQTVSAVLPAVSDGAVVAARPVETLHYAEKRDAATRWAHDPSAEGARRWLGHERITMVAVLEADSSFAPEGLGDDPGSACLSRMFQRPGLVAYRVQPACLAAAGRGGG